MKAEVCREFKKPISVGENMIMRGDYKLAKLVGKKFTLDKINDVAEAMNKRQIIGRSVYAFE